MNRGRGRVGRQGEDLRAVILGAATDGDPSFSLAMNTHVPALGAEHHRASRRSRPCATIPSRPSPTAAPPKRSSRVRPATMPPPALAASGCPAIPPSRWRRSSTGRPTGSSAACPATASPPGPRVAAAVSDACGASCAPTPGGGAPMIGSGGATGLAAGAGQEGPFCPPWLTALRVKLASGAGEGTARDWLAAMAGCPGVGRGQIWDGRRGARPGRSARDAGCPGRPAPGRQHADDDLRRGDAGQHSAAGHAPGDRRCGDHRHTPRRRSRHGTAGLAAGRPRHGAGDRRAGPSTPARPRPDRPARGALWLQGTRGAGAIRQRALGRHWRPRAQRLRPSAAERRPVAACPASRR